MPVILKEYTNGLQTIQHRYGDGRSGQPTLAGVVLHTSSGIHRCRNTNLRSPDPEAKNHPGSSINQTFGRTVITSTTALFGVLALLLFGGPAINDFAVILLVGFVSGVYSTIFVAGPLLVDWSGKRV
jgi:predicted RND superfamily exporter protein